MEKETPQIKRIYKDSVFRMLFKEKGALLSLYNAIYGTEHKEPDELKIATLENAIYMGLKNDVSCIIDAQAVDQAIRECISNGILEKFLRENRAEVVKLSIYEYDEEKHMRTLKEEGIQQGKDQMIHRMFLNNRTPQEVSEFTGESLEYLYQVHKRYLEIVQEENRYDIQNSKREST